MVISLSYLSMGATKIGNTGVCLFGIWQLYQFQEDYELAVSGYERAEALDPTFPEPIEKKQAMLTYLKNLTNMVETKVLIFCWINVYSLYSECNIKGSKGMVIVGQ